ncbi:MAG: DUF523 domain-containing protein [Bacilli bacterium]
MKKKPYLLISACLLGEKCRYDGDDNFVPLVDKLKEKYTLIPICPEVDGGLSIPRIPCEIIDGKVIGSDGNDYTSFYIRGATRALELAKKHDVKVAVLKAKSPSCGVNGVYDGTFTKTLVEGKGVAAKLLSDYGLILYEEDEIEKLL